MIPIETAENRQLTIYNFIYIHIFVCVCHSLFTRKIVYYKNVSRANSYKIVGYELPSLREGKNGNSFATS